jgi:GcrA cell cycle regulator
MAALEYQAVRAQLPALATNIWPAARLAKLIDLHEEETPFKVIAKAIGGGATKNACIGQAHRIGLPSRDPYAGLFRPRKVRVPRAVPVRTKPKKAPPPPKPSAGSIRHSTRPEIAAALALPAQAHGLITDLGTTQCKWPVGDPRAADFGFCGRLKPAAGPYCCAHATAAKGHDSDRALRGGVDRLARATGPIRQRQSSLRGAWA